MTYVDWGSVSPYIGAPKFRPNSFTIAQLATGGCMTQGVGSAISGKVYYEIAPNTASGGWVIGLGDINYAQSNPRLNPSTTTGLFWLAENGAVFVNGTNTGIGLAGATGSVIGIAYDQGAALGWIRVGATGLWNGSGTANPATGTGGVDLSVLPASLVPFACTDGSAINCTLNVATFVGTAPVGFGDITGYTWDTAPYGYNGTYTLSGGNLIFDYVSGSGAAPQAMVLANTSVSTGKYYCEVSIVDVGGGAVGLVDVAYGGPNVGGSPTTPGTAFVGLGNGHVWINGTDGGAGSAIGASSPEVLGIAVDVGAALAWFRTGAGTWNNNGSANPATGAGGYDISFMGLPLTLFGAYEGISNQINWTLNTGQSSYAETPPSGFSNFPPLAAPSSALPAPPNRALWRESLFRNPTFRGRAPSRRVGVGPQPPVGGVQLPFRSRLAETISEFFAPVLYPGRRARAVGVGPLPPPAVPQLPTRSRLLQAVAPHFARVPFKGRRLPTRNFGYGGGSGLPARASQVVLEALSKDPAGVRVSQTVLEALNKDPAGVRASQAVLEALYKQDNPTFVRASQVVLEVLVPYNEAPMIPIYPALIGLTPRIIKRPKFSTGTGVASSGREVRIGYWSVPQWEWDLEYDILADNGAFTGTTSSDLKTLIGFFLEVYGAYLPFYFLDPDFNTVTGQILGTGDGLTNAFPFQATFGLGSYTGTQNVGGVDTDGPPINIYINNVKQTSGYTLNTSTPVGNYVSFTSPPSPGAVITADFTFWYFCRLKDDSYDFEKFMNNLWDQKKITIFSLKN